VGWAVSAGRYIHHLRAQIGFVIDPAPPVSGPARRYAPTAPETRPLGADARDGGTLFSLFSDPGRACAVRVLGEDDLPASEHALVDTGGGYYEAFVPEVRPGRSYKFVLDGSEVPDPYARFLPEGVHGPACVLGDGFVWAHGEGVYRPLREHVIYEIHVGTFTPEGTFDGARARLAEIAALGATAIEIMPISAFAGGRGWGYDGVAHFAPYAGYGTPNELRAFIDDAHGRGLSVFLDVVYNHFGPAGNYLRAYSEKYFNADAKNAWGDMPNYAHPAMRRFLLSNALYWLTEFRFDGLRLDATHAIEDPSPRHILAELAERAHGIAPRKLIMCEDDRNDARLVREVGADGIWADDFHHAVHVTLTREKDGYYSAYAPGAANIAEAINGGWIYQGQTYPPSGKPRGTKADGVSAEAFIYCLQNHDQIGNRAFGDRLSEMVPAPAYATASLLLLFVPMTPLLFMGQEWAASAPFQYFTDHDPELGKLISAGRREEFKNFSAFSDAGKRAEIPDPQSPGTFARSHLDWRERSAAGHRDVLELYRNAIAFRANDPVMRETGRAELTAESVGNALVVARTGKLGTRVFIGNFAPEPVALDALPGVSPRARIHLASRPGLTLNSELPAWCALVIGTDQHG
jgi:maltooligosyltrehalose trehalohydrolase